MPKGLKACLFSIHFCLGVASGAHADVATMPGTPEQQRLFLAGAATGIGYMNISGPAPVYCPPADFVLSGDVVRAYADRGLTGPHDPEFFVIAAIFELREEFPCP
jgi:hypothetical protein